MKEPEKHKILLELALHRYDEVNKRNDIIDNKSKSMIAFVGVMLTIEFSAIPTILNTINKTPLNGKRALLLLGIASTCCYLIAILYFISAVNPMKEFKEAPSMKELVSSGKNDELNEKLKVDIVDISYDGLGVAKIDGYILFVDECLIGEKVLVEVTEMGKNYG